MMNPFCVLVGCRCSSVVYRKSKIISSCTSLCRYFCPIKWRPPHGPAVPAFGCLLSALRSQYQTACLNKRINARPALTLRQILPAVGSLLCKDHQNVNVCDIVKYQLSWINLHQRSSAIILTSVSLTPIHPLVYK